ncbi:imidazolonepropionase [bacterium]|nr:MAG: imidazolonepropionase [bacterium]
MAAVSASSSEPKLRGGSLLLHGGAVVSNEGAWDARQTGVSFERLGYYREGAFLAVEGVVTAVGDERDVREALRELPAGKRRHVVELSLNGRVLLPGFVDAHTHPLYVGDREPDFNARLQGERPVLGMAYTVEQTRAAPQTLREEALGAHLRTMFRHGTTTAEVKTGYDLRTDGELELLRTIAAVAARRAVPRVVATLTGPHTHSPEYPDDDAFVDALIEQTLPHAHAAGALYADAFCEPGYFTVEQTRRYLLAARAAGLRLRLHCDEFADGGAAALAAELAIDAADHLNCMDPGAIPGLARAGTVAVLCPATLWYMDVPKAAPARALLDAGVPVALATDFNPGTAPCASLQMAAHLGRRLLGLSPAEVLMAITTVAARSLRARAGTLEVGARADAVVLEMSHPRELGWSFGTNLATAVVAAGEVYT